MIDYNSIGSIARSEMLESDAGLISSECFNKGHPAGQYYSYTENGAELQESLPDQDVALDARLVAARGGEHDAAMFSSRLPEWLQQAMRRRNDMGEISAQGQALPPTVAPLQTAALARQSYPMRLQHGHADDIALQLLSARQSTTELDIHNTEGHVGPVIIPPPSALHSGHKISADLTNERCESFSVLPSPMVATPFTTPGPYATRRSEDRNIHDRFTPKAASPSSAFTLRRTISSSRMASVDIEPIPFSRPYIQSADTFAVKNKYFGNRKRELCLQSAINLPTIQETPDETWLTSPSFTPWDHSRTTSDCVDYHGRSPDSDLEKLDCAQKIAASATDVEQPYVFHDRARSPTDTFRGMTPRPAEHFPAGEGITSPADDLSIPSRSLQESFGPPTNFEAGQEPWMTRQQLLEQHRDDQALVMHTYHRSSSAPEIPGQYDFFSDDGAPEGGNISACPSDTLIVDIEVLEALAAAATSSESAVSTAVHTYPVGSHDTGFAKSHMTHAVHDQAEQVSTEVSRVFDCLATVSSKSS